ncbi:hypothetical protein GGS21DRAFT_369400 [Xylaria nigripes]|nr:hypothetical protein GGS21DRAFT_369400 [Xylaria nigripes]
MSGPQQPSGPPYAPPNASPGGVPELVPDVPITAVLLVIYFCFAVTNMTILQLNLRRHHKFLFSGVLFGFSMSRIVTCILRIVWAKHQHQVPLAIAANVFVNSGVLLLYVVNLNFAWRLLRARQPAIGWHKSFDTVIRAFFVGLVISLVLVIYSIIQIAYTLRPSLLRVARDIQLAAITYLLVFTILPLCLLLAAHVLPKSEDEELFGEGSLRTKAVINAFSTGLCVLIAGFRTGTAWETPRPLDRPAWYHSRPAFYVFNFALEILVLCLFALARVDRRFHVPDGSKGPGDYSQKGCVEAGVKKEESSDRSAHEHA